MIALLRNQYEKLLVAIASALLVAAATWAWTERPPVTALRRPTVNRALSGPAYQASGFREPGGLAVNWTEPAAPEGGAGWSHDVFTPPLVYYNPLTKTFCASPPGGGEPTSRSANADAFDVELLAVKLEPYRLQLTGYFGAPGDYTGVFVSAQVPETLLARAGGGFAQLGLVLKDLTVKKILVEQGDRRPVYDVAAIAVLQDERNGTEVTLDSRIRKLADTPQAVLRFGDVGTQLHGLYAGETLREGGTAYHVDRIQLDPPEVVVTRLTGSGPLPETRVLRPKATEEMLARREIEPDGRLAAPTQAGLASADTAK